MLWIFNPLSYKKRRPRDDRTTSFKGSGVESTLTGDQPEFALCRSAGDGRRPPVCCSPVIVLSGPAECLGLVCRWLIYNGRDGVLAL